MPMASPVRSSMQCNKISILIFLDKAFANVKYSKLGV